MINIMTGTEMRYDQGEECIDMCKAIKDMRELERAEGKAEGRAEGKAEGKEEGALETLIRLVKKGRLTLEEASEEAGLSPEAFKEKAESLLSGEKTS